VGTGLRSSRHPGFRPQSWISPVYPAPMPLPGFTYIDGGRGAYSRGEFDGTGAVGHGVLATTWSTAASWMRLTESTPSSSQRWGTRA